MPAIFISHSSLDAQIADEIKTALDRLGFEKVFLDFDKETGIGAGEGWEKRLYEELSRCHAVILVLTPNWLASTWCRIELAQARALGKVILPVICAPIGDRYVLPEVQSVDLLDWKAGGLERIKQRLRAITNELARGFKLDPNRSPYPGIHAFEAEDAAIYFGRDEEAHAIIERLDARRTQGGARFLVMVGASGSGKSSLLKAGVLPQLSRRRSEWVVLPCIRPGKSVLETLAKSIAQQIGEPDDWRGWQATLHSAIGIDHIEELLKDLRVGDGRAATVLLPIDQFEELFTIATPPERATFLHLMTSALDPARHLPFMVIATGRSDVLEGLLEAGELAHFIETYPLVPMPLDRVPRVVEGRQLNPIQNSVRLVADQTISGLRPSEDELAALRNAFVPHLVRIRLDDGKRVRQPARLSELPEDSLRLVRALVEARLLTTRSTGNPQQGSAQGGDASVEVTHEALFKSWPTLERWLTEEQAFLYDLERIKSAHEIWTQAPSDRKTEALLGGLLLFRAREWLENSPQRFGSRESEPVRQFIDRSVLAEGRQRSRISQTTEAARELTKLSYKIQKFQRKLPRLMSAFFILCALAGFGLSAAALLDNLDYELAAAIAVVTLVVLGILFVPFRVRSREWQLKTLFQAAKASGFKTSVRAMEATGLDKVLGSAGPFTVFAPTDEAFAALPARFRQRLFEPENKKACMRYALSILCQANIIWMTSLKRFDAAGA
jgi:energy-coupling factor transporter ATP-binding protein EcfA2